MRAVIQKVTSSCVRVDNEVRGSIKRGLNVLLGVKTGDQKSDVLYLVKKVLGLRVFNDADGVMNLSVLDLNAAGEQCELIVISQFTLYGDCRHGNRPSYIQAAQPSEAVVLYEYFVECCRASGVHVETGVFRADMAVSIENDGPVTILLDSDKNF